MTATTQRWTAPIEPDPDDEWDADEAAAIEDPRAAISDNEIDRGLHTILLVLSGRLPDNIASDARTGLASGQRKEVAAVLAHWVLGGLLPVTSEEAEAVAVVADLLGISVDGVDSAAIVAAVGRPPYVFTAGPNRPTTDSAPTLDTMLIEQAPADHAESALVDELADQVGVQGVWRCWRHPQVPTPYAPLRVFVVEADPDADLSAIAAAGQAALRSSDAQPLLSGVEVYATGEPLPPYLGLARSAGHLIGAEPAPELTVVPIFDGIDDDGGWFRADHPILDPETAELVETYLAGGTIVMDFDDDGIDVVRPERGAVVPLSLVTDGQWIWSAAAGFYLREYGLSPDPRLVDSVTSRSRVPEAAVPVNDVTALRAAALLDDVDTAQVIEWDVASTSDQP